MSTENDTVYLEDIEPQRRVASTATGSGGASTKPSPENASIKRQRTLMDMFSTSSQPSSKRLKTSASASSSQSGSIFGVQKLFSGEQ